MPTSTSTPLPGLPAPLASAPPWSGHLLALRRRGPGPALAGASLLAVVALLLDLATGPSVPLASLYLVPLLLAVTASRTRWHPYAFAAGLAVVAVVGREFSFTQGAAQDHGLTTVLRLLTNLSIYTIIAVTLRALLQAVTSLEVYARALEQARDQAWQLALTDPLTGLGNRRLFASRLAEELGRGVPVTVLLFDVDGLKRINDHWGHAAGDVALIRVAEVLRRAVRNGDLVARLGGDEFAALLTMAEPDTAQAVEWQVAELLALNHQPDDPWGRLGVSVGSSTIALALDGEAADGLLAAEAVLAAADRALYKMKAQKR